jgi:hypothetical protein
LAMLIAPNPYDQHANNAVACRSVSASEMEDRSNTTGRSSCIGAVVWEAKICPSRPPLTNPIRLASKRFGEVAVPVEVSAVQRDLPHRIRSVTDHLQQVGEDRDADVAVVEDLQRLVEDRLLPIRRHLRADDLQQRTHHGVAAAVCLGQHLVPQGAGEPGCGGGRLRRV